MSDYDGLPRPLPFPLKNPVSIVGDTPEDPDCEGSSFVWPEDSDERVLVPFLLSLNEYNILANTIDVGRDIAYGDSSIAVWSLWTRNMRCNVSICSMIIDCIMNDQDTKDAIVDMLKDSDEFNTYISERVSALTIEAVTGELFKGDCDNSVVAGRVIQIVDVMDGNNQDFFEILEVGTNDEERVAAMLDAIPILSESPVDNILDMAQGLLEDIWENYNAAITSEWKNNVSEALWCIALQKEDCALTYQDLFDFFSNRAGSTLTVQSLISNVFNYVVNGDFSTDELIASGMYTIQLAFILTGQQFNGMNLPTIGAIARDASPSSAWEDWDPCVPPVTDCTDFTSGQGAWSATDDAGHYASGEGYQGDYYPLYNSTALWIERPLQSGQPDTIQYVVTFDSAMDITAIYLYLNDAYVAGRTSLTSVTSVVFDEATVGSVWPKPGDAKIQFRIDAVGGNDWRLIEACVNPVT